MLWWFRGGREPSLGGSGRASWRMRSLHGPWEELKSDPEDGDCKAKDTEPGNMAPFPIMTTLLDWPVQGMKGADWVFCNVRIKTGTFLWARGSYQGFRRTAGADRCACSGRSGRGEHYKRVRGMSRGEVGTSWKA